MGFNISVAVWVGYIALFGIAVETGVVMVIYLHKALNRKIESGQTLTRATSNERPLTARYNACVRS